MFRGLITWIYIGIIGLVVMVIWPGFFPMFSQINTTGFSSLNLAGVSFIPYAFLGCVLWILYQYAKRTGGIK